MLSSHLRVRGFVRASKQRCACSRTGLAPPQAAASCGRQVQGAPASRRRTARQRLGAVSAAADGGKCLAT
eukprot:1040542-Pyramimonas_sp.AAC.1